uniref:Metalloendopeptidase n=1 Tax=Parastrongyloides trichosuri TaxID=131310 RepID=A0A0N4ZAB4_PARTI
MPKNRSKDCNLTIYTADSTKTFFNSSGKRRCSHFIKTDKENRVGIFLSKVDTVDRKICRTDVGLEVKYKNDKGTTGLCLCGNYKKKNITIISEGEEVMNFILSRVIFKIDNKNYFDKNDKFNYLLKKRAIYLNKKTNWTSPILYHIDKKLNDKNILSVLNYISNHTCLNFVKGSSKNEGKTRLIYIKKNVSSSPVGKAQNETLDTDIWLNDRDAKSFGAIAHETLHALGTRHEHQRADRDNFIKVLESNISEIVKNEITKIYVENFVTFGIHYDYGSIMHYSGRLSEISNKLLMKVKNIKPFQKMMGQIDMFSFNDIKLINLYYCSKECSMSQHKCKNGGYLHWYLCGQCICPKGYYGSDCGYFKSSFTHRCGSDNLYATDHLKTIHARGMIECSYRIKSTSNTKLWIYVVKVNTKKRSVCSENYGFQIKYLNDKGTTGLCLCGEYEKISITSEGPEVYIRYCGLENSNYFLLKYQETYSKDIESFIKYQNQSFKII